MSSPWDIASENPTSTDESLKVLPTPMGHPIAASSRKAENAGDIARIRFSTLGQRIAPKVVEWKVELDGPVVVADQVLEQEEVNVTSEVVKQLKELRVPVERVKQRVGVP